MPISTTGKWRAAKGKDGFTLIELTVVIFILGLILTRTIPRIEVFLFEKDADLKKSLTFLSGTIQNLHHRASSTNNIYRLHYHLQHNEFWISALGQETLTEGGDILTDSPEKLNLYGEILFKDVVNPPNSPVPGKTTDGESFTLFFPNGMAERTIIHLEDRSSGKMFSLIIKPLTGGVEIHESYVEENIL